MPEHLGRTLSAMADAGIELVCIDRWSHGRGQWPGYQTPAEIDGVEQRFDRNIARAVKRAIHPVTVRKFKGPSIVGLSKLLVDGKFGAFDMVYVDGGHGAPDVLADAVLAPHGPVPLAHATPVGNCGRVGRPAHRS